MNARMLPRFISLLGKLIAKYDVMSDVKDFTEEERDILRLALTEYNFYHAHERVEAGTSPDYDTIKKQAIAEAGKREILSRKVTR